ncbi:MAG: IS66 family transposase zinc-finger binding domain-containing protein [Paracoccaceae bacterium]
MIEPASILCPGGRGETSRIGEQISELLDVIPAQFPILVTRCPRYACHRCSQAVVQSRAPELIVAGGLSAERLISWIIISKFGDHLPFLRQTRIF